MKHLIKYKDGHVGIMNTVSDDINPSNEIKKWHEDDIAKVESHCPISDEDIPKERYFRNAWMHEGDKIKINMDEAKNIHREKLRELRKPILESLDLEYIRASELGDDTKKSDIVMRKKLLRDIPEATEILNAQTPEELIAFMPDILMERKE
jgi:hypothetical protein